MSRYGYRHHFGHKWGYGDASFIQKPPEAVEVVEEETIDRFPAPITVQPPRPTFSWVLAPQIEEPIDVELQPFLTVSDFQPRIRPAIGFRRGAAGAPVVPGKFVSVTDRQPPIAPIQRIFIRQIDEAVEVERLPFISAPDPGRRISFLASLVVIPQIVEGLTEELRKFHVGPDRIRPIREFASVVRPPQVEEAVVAVEELRQFVVGADFVRRLLDPQSSYYISQIPVLEALRRFELGADRQHGLPVAEARIVIQQIPEIVVLPIELLKFITGSPRLRWEFIHRTGIWLPEDFTSEVAVVVRRKELRRGWYRTFRT